MRDRAVHSAAAAVKIRRRVKGRGDLVDLRVLRAGDGNRRGDRVDRSATDAPESGAEGPTVHHTAAGPRTVQRWRARRVDSACDTARSAARSSRMAPLITSSVLRPSAMMSAAMAS